MPDICKCNISLNYKKKRKMSYLNRKIKEILNDLETHISEISQFTYVNRKYVERAYNQLIKMHNSKEFEQIKQAEENIQKNQMLFDLFSQALATIEKADSKYRIDYEILKIKYKALKQKEKYDKRTAT